MADIRSKLIVDTKDAKRSVDTLKGAFKGLLAAVSVRELGLVANAFQEITNKLRTVTPANESTADSFQRVLNIARDTRGGLEETADLFFRLSKASENLGLSTDEVAKVTELFTKTLKISGAGAQETASAILQFSQAMASGRLQGDEFRSLNETNSDLMDRLAKAIGKPRGELKQLASEGKLSAKVIANALLESADAIEGDFGKTTTTLAESLTSIRNEFINLVGRIESDTGVFQGIANTFKVIANNLDIVGAALAGVFAAQVAGQIMNVVKAIRAFRAANQAAAASAVLLQAVTGVGLVKVGAGLLAAGGTLALMNTMFDEQAETVDDIVTDVNRLEGSTKDLFDQNLSVTEEKKKQKKLTDEQTRLLADQLEEFKGITSELELGRDELERQLDLEEQMANASDVQRDRLQAIADLERQRTDALINLNNLTLIGNEERLQKEREINDEYDERIRLTNEANAALTDIQIQTEMLDFYFNLNRAARDYRDEIAVLEAIQKGSTDQQVRDLNELASMYGQLQMQLAEINKETFGVMDFGINEAIAAEMVSAGEMTQEEADQYSKRIENFLKFEKEMIDKLKAFQEKRLQIEDMGTEFSSGFQNAFKEFERSIKDAADYGEKIFNTMTDGFADAILAFVETGKLSFKDLFKSLLVEIIKMQANRLFLSIFGTGGPLASLFSFQGGGFTGTGARTGGVDGRGGFPAILHPNETVIDHAMDDMGRGGPATQVTYNINAVDTQSFQQALARDPEFLFAVTQQGAKSLPRS